MGGCTSTPTAVSAPVAVPGPVAAEALKETVQEAPQQAAEALKETVQEAPQQAVQEPVQETPVDAAQEAEPTPVMAEAAKPYVVLFACIHNAGRSQMSCAMFNYLVDPTKAVGISAGTEPGERVHPGVVEAMLELGVDLSGNKPQFLSVELAHTANLLITMGCGEACPYVPGLKKLDWPLRDPKGLPIEEVRVIRDDIKERVTELATEHGWLKQ